MNRKVLGLAAAAVAVLMFAAGATVNRESRVAGEMLSSASNASGALRAVVGVSKIDTATPVSLGARCVARTDTPVYVASSASSGSASEMSHAERLAKAAAEWDAKYNKMIEDYKAGLYND